MLATFDASAQTVVKRGDTLLLADPEGSLMGCAATGMTAVAGAAESITSAIDAPLHPSTVFYMDHGCNRPS